MGPLFSPEAVTRSRISSSSRAFSIAILVGKGAHQFDLPLVEWLHSFPGKCDNADRLAVAQERHTEHSTSPGRHSPG